MEKMMEEVIFCRIVANLLYKKIAGIGVKFSNSPLYDLIVEDKSNDLFFGVKVGDMDYQSTPEYAKYLETLKQSNYAIDDERMPIILMCADKDTELIKFGYQLTWQRYRASIQTRVTLRDVNPDSWCDMMENLKEMDRVIRVLSNEKIHIVKRIAVEKKMSNGGLAHAEIIYLRKFTDHYKMKQKEVMTEQERFKRMLTGIPEDEYSNDLLDDIILSGIEREFPAPKRKSQILLLNTELQDLRRELERTKKMFNISVEPDYSDLMNCQAFFTSFNILQIPLILYHDPTVIYNNFFIDMNIPVMESVEEWIKNYGLLEKLRNDTLRNIADVVPAIE